MTTTTTLAALPTWSSEITVRRNVVEDFLKGRSPRTVEAYRQDLQDFAGFLEAETAEDAVRAFLAGDRGKANGIALDYKENLLARGLAPATVNRRLAAVRSLVKVARILGLVEYTVEVEAVPSEAYRDTSGPGRTAVRRLLDELTSRTDAKAARDLALVRLLYDLGLRRGEAVALDLADVDLASGKVSVLGKGRRERESLTLPDPTKDAITRWIAVRGEDPGPLFVNFDRAGKGSRLTGRSVARVLAAVGDAVGVRVRPHGLRHTSITDALDALGGDERKVQRFSRHRDVRVLFRYDDSRKDFQGEVARIVAARV